MVGKRIRRCTPLACAISHIRLAFFFALSVVVVWQMPQTARAQSGAHGDGHAEHHSEYKDWKQPSNGLSCCNDQDCRPTRADLTEEGWRAWDGSKWLLVPWSAVLDVRAKDGRTHLCATPEGKVFCLVPADPRI